MHNLNKYLNKSIESALQEDLGKRDITALLIPENTNLSMALSCREEAILCGRDWFDAAFRHMDPDVRIDWHCEDGDLLHSGQSLCEISGLARALLSAERTALNFLQTLSGTATITHRYQQLIQHTGCRILDTRKTIPGLRVAQKYAVRCGGGNNHRMGLFDAYLLKENHLAAAGSMSAAVHRARELEPDVLLEVEVENLDQLDEAIACGVDRALLDNFSLAQLRQAVETTNGRIKLEASGNIDEQSIREVAETGIDYISIGALTKHVRAVDFSLRFID